VKKCWASLFTPRAIFYRFEQKLNKDKISVAVVVQKMIDSKESGIAFSVHPVTQDENQIIIEAGFGLGEAIVSGSITPDSYIVDKQDFNILDINVNKQTKALYKKTNGGNEWKELKEKCKKQVLTEKEIIELSKLIVKIENHYGFPCDIEWAKEKGKFYIVQSRPITTLSGIKEKKKQWNVVRSRYIPAVWPFICYFSWNAPELIKGANFEYYHVWKKGNVQAIWSENCSLKLRKGILDIITKNKNDLKNFRKKGIPAGEKVIKFCETFIKKINNKSIEDYLEFFRKFNKLYQKIMKTNMLFWVFANVPLEKIIYKLLENYKESEKREIFSTMSVTKEDSYSKIEENKFIALVKIAKKRGILDNDVKKKIKEFSEEYFWFPYEYVGPEIWNEKRITEKIKESLNVGDEQRITNTQKIKINA